MPSDIESRLQRLEDREVLMLRLLDSRKDPWTFFQLENDLNNFDVKGIETVMEAVNERLADGRETEPAEFEEELSLHIPDKERPKGYTKDFVTRLLITFSTGGQWPDVVEHFRGEYNIPPSDRLEH